MKIIKKKAIKKPLGTKKQTRKRGPKGHIELTDYVSNFEESLKEIQFMVDRYYQVQKHRIAIQGQVRALEEIGETNQTLNALGEQFEDIEKGITKYLKLTVETHPIAEWLLSVKGIGPILAAGLLSTIDPHKTKHASSVWKYAGLDVCEDGKGRSKCKEHLVDRQYTARNGKVKTKKSITFNPFLKALCWKLGESFVKSKGKYREIYVTSREFYDRKFPEKVVENGKTRYSDGHKHMRAKRRTVKIFLADFWAQWRQIEGLSVSEPFQHRGEKK